MGGLGWCDCTPSPKGEGWGEGLFLAPSPKGEGWGEGLVNFYLYHLKQSKDLQAVMINLK